MKTRAGEKEQGKILGFGFKCLQMVGQCCFQGLAGLPSQLTMLPFQHHKTPLQQRCEPFGELGFRNGFNAAS